MLLRGDDAYGWSARLLFDPNWIWATKKQNAILACKQRQKEVSQGKQNEVASVFINSKECVQQIKNSTCN